MPQRNDQRWLKPFEKNKNQEVELIFAAFSKEHIIQGDQNKVCIK